MHSPSVIVVMGVAGVGKTTFGRALSHSLGFRFEDADAHHSPANLQKMATGRALDDTDRAPWLARLSELVTSALTAAEARGGGLVLACSALRAPYRERLSTGDARVALVHLVAPREVLARRLDEREGHFLKAALLESQLAALEAPTHERVLTLDATRPVDELVDETRSALFTQAALERASDNGESHLRHRK